MDTIYDVIILGGGPAGLAAGLYAGRSRLHTLLIEKGADGGQIALSSEVENYPGQLAEGESGPALAARMAKQAENFGVVRCLDTIRSVNLTGSVKILSGSKGDYQGRSVIIAAGSVPKRIGCVNEDKFIGKGISFCAACDAAFFRDLPVFVVGGGDSAVEEALFLTKFARSVTLIHRRDSLRAAKSIQEKAFQNPKISFLWNSVVEKTDGSDLLGSITVRNVKSGEQSVFRADPKDGLLGLFVFIGHDPNTKLFQGVLELENGFIKTDENMRTNLPGVFAAGDIRVKSLRQAVTAAADGAVAAVQAELYIG